MDESKRNCWQYMRCGREVGGTQADKLGVCPAATEGKLDGVHGGVNAGRSCWVVAGTVCGGRIQGAFAQKGTCTTCPFYRTVISEEMTSPRSPGFQFTTQLMRRLDRPNPTSI